MCHVDKGLDEVEGADAAVVLQDERAVQLEHVDREAAQVGQAGIAGAEVVDRDLHPQRLQLAQHGGGAFHVFDQGAFGQLQLQVAGCQPGRLQRGADFADEAGLGQLARRDIHRHPHRLAEAGDQALGGAAGFVQHPAADRVDQAGFLGDADEVAGGDAPQLRMVPADQRFQPDDGHAA